MGLSVLEWVIGIIVCFLPEWFLIWLDEEDHAAILGVFVSFVATGILASVLLGWTDWPEWVNWTVGFLIAFLYFFAVFCFSSWRTSRRKDVNAK